MTTGRLAFLGALILIIGIIASTSLFVVDQRQQALVLQFGDPIKVVQKPGLNVKLPFVQNVIRYDRRVLGLDPPAEEVILIDQKRIIVNAFARYRITDPLQYFQAVRTESTFDDRFGRVLNSAVRGVLAERPIEDLLSPRRDNIMQKITAQVRTDAKNYGVEIVDIRIGRTELPEEVSQTVYGRMRSERLREANLLRAEGEESSRRIRAEADREKTVILAEADRQSSILRGGGDAEVNRVLGEAYTQDSEFFAFLRSLEIYKQTFAGGNTTMVIAPDSDFFKYFNNIYGSSVAGDAPAQDSGARK